MSDQTGFVFGLAVILAYVYAFVGGFTDAANAIATSVGTRVLTPRAAVAVAGGFNLLGGLTGTAVALTIGKGLVDPSALSLSCGHPGGIRARHPDQYDARDHVVDPRRRRARRLSAVRWGITFDIVLSWVLTVPCTILLGALAMVVLGAVLPLLR